MDNIRIDWDEYFLEITIRVAARSTCLRRNYGAIIVRDNIIISTGYNGSARGIDNCCDSGICIRQAQNVPRGERYELCRAVHAEQNAIINGDPLKMKGATIYVAGKDRESAGRFILNSIPCMLCARMIVNAGIKDIVYRGSMGEIERIPAIKLVRMYAG